MNRFNLGDIVYFIANGYHIREATVIRTGSGFCTIKFNDNETPAGTRVRSVDCQIIWIWKLKI